MQRHNETITRLLKYEGKAHLAHVENLLILLDVYDKMPPRPNGIQKHRSEIARFPSRKIFGSQSGQIVFA